MKPTNTKTNLQNVPSVKTTALPTAIATENNATGSTTAQVKYTSEKLSKTRKHLNKSSCVAPVFKHQLNSSNYQEPTKSKMDNTKNLFTNFSLNQSLKSNPLFQGLTGNSEKTWPVSIFQNVDETKETPTTTSTSCSLTKGVSTSTFSISSNAITQKDKTKSPCNFCEVNKKNGSACSCNDNSTTTTTTTTTTETTNMLTNNVNSNQSNFFKTTHSTMCIPQQSSSVIISSPFKHLMVGPKISNMPSPFNGLLTNNNSSTPSTFSQQTPVTNTNANQEKNCKILFHSGKVENLFSNSNHPESAVANNNGESCPHVLKTNSATPPSSSSSSSEHKSKKNKYATMDPAQLAIIRQRKRDRKFRKLQSLSALMRAPDDRHSMGPLTPLRREIVPNKILGRSTPNLSPKLSSLTSNPFCRPSLTGSNQLSKFSANNPWRGENTKKPCSFIHEPSLKNSAVLSQNPLELPKRKFDYQRNMNSSNSNFSAPNIWKSMESREPVKAFRASTSSSSVIDDALRIAALKFIKNEVKDKESTSQKEATPISAEIFGSNKIKNPSFLLPPSKDDTCSEPASPSSARKNTKGKSPTNKTSVWLWVNEPNRHSIKSPTRHSSKSRKRTSSSRRKSQVKDDTCEQSPSLTNDLNKPAEDLSDTDSKETDKVSPESRRNKVSERTKEKEPSVVPRRRGRPPLPSKLKRLKSVKRRGRPPLLGTLKAKLHRRAVKSQKTFNKDKVAEESSNIPRRRGRPPKSSVPKPEPEAPKLTDEDVLKVKLNIPRKRGRPSKAEAMLREMAVAHLAATKKPNSDVGKEVNTGLSLTIRPRPARKQCSASRQQQPESVENAESGSPAAKKIRLDPVSVDAPSSVGANIKPSSNAIEKNVEVETTPEILQNNLACKMSSGLDKGQHKKKPFKNKLKNDPDYVNKHTFEFNMAANNKTPSTPVTKTTKEDAGENGSEMVPPVNRSRPLLLRNVKKNSKPLPTFTDSDESDGEESTDTEYKSPKKKTPIQKIKPFMPKMKSPIKICKPVPPTGPVRPPIYNVPRVMLPPGIKDTGIPCKMCGRVHTQDHFFKYMELKSTNQPYRCPLCQQYFTWSCLFIEHMRSHPENTAQYKCEYCNSVSRKISAYFNCRITHCPPSKEWLELQKMCDEYLAIVNESKAKRNSRYNRYFPQRIVKSGEIKTEMVSKTNLANMNDNKDKTAPSKMVMVDASSTVTEAKNYAANLNESKDKKNARCSKVTPSKVVKHEVTNTMTEMKEISEKVQAGVGKVKNKGSPRKNSVSKKPFECKVCQKTFLTFDFLTKHKQLHKSKRPYSCKKCGKRFATRAYFTVHKRTYHSDTEKSFKCEICNQTFPYLHAYNNHMSQLGHLSQEEHCKHTQQSHVCDICQRGFKLRQSLINHVRTHTGERPFVCEVCNKGFTQTGSLDRHRRIHERELRETPRRQERSFLCKPCKRAFTNETTYQNHMRGHVEDNRFYCDICDENYPNAQRLKSHKHNEQRPYKCKNCGRCYKLKETLLVHKRVCGL